MPDLNVKLPIFPPKSRILAGKIPRFSGYLGNLRKFSICGRIYGCPSILRCPGLRRMDEGDPSSADYTARATLTIFWRNQHPLDFWEFSEFQNFQNFYFCQKKIFNFFIFQIFWIAGVCVRDRLRVRGRAPSRSSSRGHMGERAYIYARASPESPGNFPKWVASEWKTL